MYGEKQSTLDPGTAQKRHQTISRLHLRPILGTARAYNSSNETMTKTRPTLRKEKNLTSRVTTLLHLNAQCSTKNNKTEKETKKYGPFKAIYKSTETMPEKDLTADLLDKDFKRKIIEDVQRNKAVEKVKEIRTKHKQRQKARRQQEKVESREDDGCLTGRAPRGAQRQVGLAVSARRRERSAHWG